jgi:uncharacterized protein
MAESIFMIISMFFFGKLKQIIPHPKAVTYVLCSWLETDYNLMLIPMLPPLDLPILIFIFLITLFSAALQGAVGYGVGLILSPLLVLIDPRYSPGPVSVVALILSAMMVQREWKTFDIKGIIWAMGGLIPGSIIGAAVIGFISPSLLSLLMAGLILVAIALSISGLHFKPQKAALFAAGTLSGFICAFTAMGGPPIALVYQDAPGPTLRPTLAGFFVANSIMTILVSIPIGRFGLPEIGMALVMLPGILAGFLLSGRLRKYLDRGYTRPAVLAVSALTALLVIARQIFYF